VREAAPRRADRRFVGIVGTALLRRLARRIEAVRWLMLKPRQIRFRVDAGDAPPEKAARRLHLTEAQFAEVLPRLLLRGFPAADPDTGMFDLDAIDAWRKRRPPALFGLTDAILKAEPAPPNDMVERFQLAREARLKARRKGGK
jgi:hypothetical protein